MFFGSTFAASAPAPRSTYTIFVQIFFTICTQKSMFYILSGLSFLAFLICTGAPNNPQNNDIYGPSVTKRNMLDHSVCCKRIKTAASQLWCPWVCPKLGLIDLIFVDVGVKMKGAYYREMLLTQKLLPEMCEICAVFFTFQQCNAPAAAYRAWETINILFYLTTRQAFAKKRQIYM